MFFISKRNKDLFNNIIEYLIISQTVFENFNKTLKHYFNKGIDSKYEFLMNDTDKNESNADNMLVKIKLSLYKKSLLPESREDILILLERVDDIVDNANLTLKYIYSHNFTIPKFLHSNIKELLKISNDSFKLVIQSIHDLLGKKKNIIELARKISNYESICDDLQLKIIKTIFSSNEIKNFFKIIIRDFVRDVGNLSDLCEDVSDLVTILNIKRLV